jgi:transcriptional regulator with XRE-family HTH domain
MGWSKMAAGTEIRRHREDLGLSMREVSRRTNISLNHLSRIERGLASMSMTSMMRLSEVLRVSPEWLARQLQAAEEQRKVKP